MSKKEYTVIEILDFLRRRKQGDGTRMIAKAGGLEALKKVGNPADVLKETKTRMFSA